VRSISACCCMTASLHRHLAETVLWPHGWQPAGRSVAACGGRPGSCGGKDPRPRGSTRRSLVVGMANSPYAGSMSEQPPRSKLAPRFVLLLAIGQTVFALYVIFAALTNFLVGLGAVLLLVSGLAQFMTWRKLRRSPDPDAD
jgi:hypothetical protein